MFIQYHDLDISFVLEKTHFRMLNFALEHLHRIIPAHSHGDNSYEIHYTQSGKGLVKIGEQTYEVTPGTLYLTGPHVPHAQISDPENPMREYCIYLQLHHSVSTGTRREELISAFEEKQFWIGTDRFAVQPILEQILSELRERKTGYMVYVETLLKQLIVLVVRNGQNGGRSVKQFQAATPAQAQDFIIEESFLYEYPTLTLEVLSRKLGLSCRQTERLMQGNYSRTFLQKRGDARMSAASILLIYTSRSIASIAEETGYSSAEHFSCAFKKYYGISAREYRKRETAHLPAVQISPALPGAR